MQYAIQPPMPDRHMASMSIPSLIQSRLVDPVFAVAKQELFRMRARLAHCMVLMLMATAATAEPATVKIDQITDSTARAATHMFRFEPDLVRLQQGETVTFLNSRGEHTVHSVSELWPAGVPAVSISNQPSVEVRFDVAGVYGFRCARHGRYGMVMLVVVGNPPTQSAASAALAGQRIDRRERAAFERLLNAAVGMP